MSADVGEVERLETNEDKNEWNSLLEANLTPLSTDSICLSF